MFVPTTRRSAPGGPGTFFLNASPKPDRVIAKVSNGLRPHGRRKLASRCRMSQFNEPAFSRELSRFRPAALGRLSWRPMLLNEWEWRRQPAKSASATIYKAGGNPSGNQWYWGLNGVQTAPARSTVSSEYSRMRRPNLPSRGALGSRPRA
jgi:hypothetical protein